METTIKSGESWVVKCPKCGNILYVIGREINTCDIMCNCHRVITSSPFLRDKNTTTVAI